MVSKASVEANFLPGGPGSISVNTIQKCTRPASISQVGVPDLARLPTQKRQVEIPAYWISFVLYFGLDFL